ncbi:RloB family protein [Nocardiopsis sp. ARC36]
MKEKQRFSNVSIDVGDKHGEPYGLVLAAQKRQGSAPKRRRDQGTEYDEVWCVIDVEAPRPHDSLDSAIRLARHSGIEIAFANPCFELWLYLHQREPSGYLETDEAIAKMKGLGCCYTGRKDFDPEHFLGQPQQDAIRRAELLEKRHEDVLHPRDKNPWTDIHRLVRGLLDQG